MNSFIARLDDPTALRVLYTIVRHSLPSTSNEQPLDPAIILSLGAQVGAEATQETVKDGDIARSALQLLASKDRETQNRIEGLASARTEKFLDPVTGGILLTTVIVTVLQSKVDLHYDNSGWKFDVSKPTVSLPEFKDLLTKLMSWWSPQR